MNTYISMLRGINVGGKKKIRMVELRDLYSSLGFANVRSYVQSGNVVFDSPEQDRVKLAATIETQIEQVFGYDVSIFLKTRDDFQQIRQNTPFLNGREEEPAKLYITFLYQLPDESKLQALAQPKGSTDEFFILNREIFLFCPNGYGRTKLSNNFFERKLGVAATTRNWKTVNALYQMASEATS